MDQYLKRISNLNYTHVTDVLSIAAVGYLFLIGTRLVTGLTGYGNLFDFGVMVYAALATGWLLCSKSR